ncbi:CHAT domain-containing protein [Actinomadura sp. J1-007]|uniref:CHAT domain-containing protein n=1 Tax=Actinomadura sp. J1-007 TaxID=2661913 RepID=UPI001371FD0F|nr:CHAT domain-containing protein [Actinomadura sp. J1-007]
MPPFPERFRDVADASHVWGDDPDADTARVFAEVGGLSEGGDHAWHLLPASAFLERLYLWCAYDPRRAWVLRNARAVLLRDFHRATGEIRAGLDSLALFQECADATRTTLERGMARYDIARTAAALLSPAPPELALLGGQERYCRIGVEAAREALEIYRAQPGSEHIRNLVTRTEQCLHNLLAAGNTLDGIAAAPDRSGALPSRARFAPLLHLFGTHLERGDSAPALAILQESARLTEHHFAARPLDGAGLDAAGRADSLFRGSFDELARLYVAEGRAGMALAATETVRAITVRPAPDPAPGPDLAFGPRPGGTAGRRLARRLGTDVSAARVADALDRLGAAGWPSGTAICVFSACDGFMSVVLAARRGTSGWDVECDQWSILQDEFDRMVDGLDLAPGPQRERRLARACEAANGFFFAEMLPLLHARGLDGLAISGPGPLARLPYEAIPVEGGTVLGDTFEVFSLPSVLLAADLAVLGHRCPPRRALVVAYGGEAMPGFREEAARIEELWNGPLDLLDGAAISKRDVLDALGGDYDLVHLACPATPDGHDEAQGDPLASALRLNDARDPSAALVTAADLFGRGFSRGPVVTVSPGPSAPPAPALTRGLLHMGARGMIVPGGRCALRRPDGSPNGRTRRSLKATAPSGPSSGPSALGAAPTRWRTGPRSPTSASPDPPPTARSPPLTAATTKRSLDDRRPGTAAFDRTVLRPSDETWEA